ncbi:Hypothetical protein SMAX5B_002562 [Scophthalmus maximus]|uniref:Uncharacterized protein n=1 Tax=Scophthalmus maximus TaxID=52904 RepID=A0A2U9AX02_SCOMX|nr:Hypothetical protein SMAX5B_002562 [Scophthalmus maximus]
MRISVSEIESEVSSLTPVAIILNGAIMASHSHGGVELQYVQAALVGEGSWRDIRQGQQAAVSRDIRQQRQESRALHPR